jgi:hypothetical protein
VNDIKIWANSGDSHLMEPRDLFEANLAADLAARMPHSELEPDGRYERITVDGRSFRRKVPFAKRPMVDGDGRSVLERAPGANRRVSGPNWSTRPSGCGCTPCATPN